MNKKTHQRYLKSTLTIILCGLMGALALPSKSFAESQIYIKIGEAKTVKKLLALPPLQYFGAPVAGSKYQEMGSELFEVITNDLLVSSYFQMIKQSAFLEDTAKVGLKPVSKDEPKGFKFDTWKELKADFLIRAGYSMVGDKVTLDTYLYHVPKGELVVGKKYESTASNVRKVAHTFANDVLKALTGKEGMFLSKIVTTSDRDGGKSREVFIMDWDGASPTKVSNHQSITISPAWSPDGKKIAYTAYVQRAKSKMRNADLFIYEVETGKRFLTSYRPGINSGAAFAPDNKNIYLTLSQSGNPDIYKMAIDGTLQGKITNGPNGAINVEPSVSPDGSKLAFSSDRHGRPMIYTMANDGSNITQITFAGVFNSTPVWSPDGGKLAFAGQSEDHFDIFVINTDKTNLQRITDAKKANGKAAHNEDPSFSPDGRFLMYTSNRTGTNQIYISTVDGSEERRVTNDKYNYYKPKWSQNLE